MTKLKINILVSGIFKSGGMKIIFEYCNRMTNLGHDVIVYYPTIDYNFYNGKVNNVMNVKHLFWGVKKFLKRRDCEDISYSRNFKIKQVFLLNNSFIRDADVSIATIWHTASSLKDLKASKGKKFYFVQDYEIWNSDETEVNRSYNLGIPIITTTKYLHDLLKTKFGVDSEIVPYGFDFQLYNNISKRYDSDKKCVTFVDYRLEKKNVKSTIVACEMLKRSFDNLRFVSFGLDKYNELPEYVEFIKDPEEEKIRDIYFATDIFIFSSKTEGFGMPIAEAMASKCAVVSTMVGFLPEYATNFEDVIYTDPENPETIFNAVKMLVEDELLLRKLSENGSVLVRKSFSWDKSVLKFLNIISGD